MCVPDFLLHFILLYLRKLFVVVAGVLIVGIGVCFVMLPPVLLIAACFSFFFCVLGLIRAIDCTDRYGGAGR